MGTEKEGQQNDGVETESGSSGWLAKAVAAALISGAVGYGGGFLTWGINVQERLRVAEVNYTHLEVTTSRFEIALREQRSETIRQFDRIFLQIEVLQQAVAALSARIATK